MSLLLTNTYTPCLDCKFDSSIHSVNDEIQIRRQTNKARSPRPLSLGLSLCRGLKICTAIVEKLCKHKQMPCALWKACCESFSYMLDKSSALCYSSLLRVFFTGAKQTFQQTVLSLTPAHTGALSLAHRSLYLSLVVGSLLCGLVNWFGPAVVASRTASASHVSTDTAQQ